MANDLLRHSFHVAQTKNQKLTGKKPQTGPDVRPVVYATTSSRSTCPAECPHKKENGGGCYAENHPMRHHWDAVSSGDRGSLYADHLSQIAALPAGSLLRIFQAGDLPANQQGRLSRTFARGLAKAAKGLKVWGYSHHRPELGENLEILRTLNRQGVNVNVSCETLPQADAMIRAGLPAVVVVPSDEKRTHWRSPDGHPVMVCPAQTTDGASCATCLMCCRGRGGGSDPRLIIAFKSHGASRRRVDSALETLAA